MPGQSPPRKLLFRARMHSAIWRPVREGGRPVRKLRGSTGLAEPALVALRHSRVVRLSAWSDDAGQGMILIQLRFLVRTEARWSDRLQRQPRSDAIRLVQAARASDAARPSSRGRSVRREMPKPRGRMPSAAAWTMSGARNASEMVMRAERSLMPSRRAIASMSSTDPVMISSSQQRPRAMPCSSLERASARIGRAAPSRSCGPDHLVLAPHRLRRPGDHHRIGGRRDRQPPSVRWISTLPFWTTTRSTICSTRSRSVMSCSESG